MSVCVFEEEDEDEGKAPEGKTIRDLRKGRRLELPLIVKQYYYLFADNHSIELSFPKRESLLNWRKTRMAFSLQ